MWFRTFGIGLGEELGNVWRCGLQKPYTTVNGAQWAILVRTQKARKSGTKLYYKVQMGTSPQALRMTIWQRTCVHFVYSLIFMSGCVHRRWTSSYDGGQWKAAHYSGHGMDMDDCS
jgi:hypothetical protein